VNLNGGNLQVGTAAIPNGATAKATIELAPGETIATGSFFVGEQNQKQGLVDHLSGDVTVSGRLQIGHWPNETATYNLTGGSLNLTAAAPATFPYTITASEQAGGIYLGVDGAGVMTQSGGTLTTNFIVLDNRANTGIGLNMATGVDTYTLSGGTLVLKGQGIISRNASTAVNLNGGTIVAVASTALDSDQITVGGLVELNTNGNVINNFGALRGPGALMVNGGGTFRMGDSVDLSGGSLGNVTAQVDAGTTLLSDRATSAVWTGGLDGAGTLTKANAGMLTLTGNSPGFTGLTQINGGALVVEGSLAGSTVAVNAGGTLQGSGVIGALSLNAGGTLAIGTSPGLLDAGATTFNGGTFAVELNSTTVETGYDQLRVTGSVSFGANTALNLALGFTPVMGDSFTIVDNDLADAVNLAGGLFTFSGTPLADDAEFGNAFFTGETRFRIDYDGGLAGGGNDIVLTVIPEPGSAVLILCGINSLMGLRRSRRRA
jgi:fibronectin-binding autotransporter adhesin